VSECVLSRDEHEYYGDTMRHCSLLKRKAFEIMCLRAPKSIIWHWTHSVSVNRTHNLLIERRTLDHAAIAAPAKSTSPMPGCQVMLWCAVEEPTIRKKD